MSATGKCPNKGCGVPISYTPLPNQTTSVICYNCRETVTFQPQQQAQQALPPSYSAPQPNNYVQPSMPAPQQPYAPTYTVLGNYPANQPLLANTRAQNVAMTEGTQGELVIGFCLAFFLSLIGFFIAVILYNGSSRSGTRGAVLGLIINIALWMFCYFFIGVWRF